MALKLSSTNESALGTLTTNSPTPKERVLGIIGCQVLEDEMAYVVARDPDVKQVVVIDSTSEGTVASKIQRMAPEKRLSLFDENFDLRQFQMSNGVNVIIWVKPLELHQSPPLLRETVVKAIGQIESLTQSVLIFYGQCGNAFNNMEIITRNIHVPVTILKDREGGPVDDCYGIALGGRKEYRDFLINQPSPAYILNTMWVANWRHFMLDIQMMRDPNDIEEAKEVFEYMDYKKAVGLNTGLTDQSAFSEQLIEFANIFGLVPESHRCSLHVVEDSYKEAKKFLMGSV
ncbi:MAG: DUF1638 domain-containing protein [Methanomassiliicoccales archaeon]|jgi:hypothetical protein|nr:DUF1638 domain-containing protein [Methanomassiliicoccales archaeon]